MPDELVFSVAGATATASTPISLADAGFHERTHLQEWVIANPEMLGRGVMIVTFEFDRWWSSGGTHERDRLDILGLDREGHLVVAELKRDAAPDSVEMQAIKYAAMASRFTVDALASQHAEYLSRRGNPTTSEEARELLEAHSDYELQPETLAQPRIVLLASSFPPVVTATVVWLTEMSLDITLVRLQAYRAQAMTLVTVSQLYPVADVEDFTVAPVRSARRATAAESLPEVPWAADDLARLRGIARPTVLAALDLCSRQPEEWIPLRQVEQAAGRTNNEARADLAGLTMIVKGRFGSSNWPFTVQWQAGGERQQYYSIDPATAALWLALSAEDDEAHSSSAPTADTLTPAPSEAAQDVDVNS